MCSCDNKPKNEKYEPMENKAGRKLLQHCWPTFSISWPTMLVLFAQTNQHFIRIPDVVIDIVRSL